MLFVGGSSRGRHPCVNVPSGFTTQNNVQLPLSVSFIGGQQKEAEALRVAKA